MRNSKSSILTFMVFIIIILLVQPVYCNSINLKSVNEYIESEYNLPSYYLQLNFINHKLNSTISSDYDVIVYNKPLGGAYSNLSHRFEPRFLGETNFGENYPNYNYAYDTKSSIYFDDMKWISQPYKNEIILNDPRYSWVSENPFTSKFLTAKVKKSFLSGMHYQHGNPKRPAGDWFRGDKVNKWGQPITWENYIHIIDPPTEWTHGSAMLWHISDLDGKLYYIDVRLTRFMDLAGKLQIRHRTVTGVRLSAYDFERSMPDGTEAEVERTEVDGYEYVGYGVSASDGTAPLQSNGQRFRMDYEYAHERQLYTVTFYYRPITISLPSMPSGAIRVSHPVFDVSRGIPTGERADIEARIDKPLVMDYRSRRVDGSESVRVLVRQPYSVRRQGRLVQAVAEETHTVSRSYYYYEVTQLYAYGLSHVNVMNPKLAPSSVVTLRASGARPQVTFQKQTHHVDGLSVSGARYDGSLGAYVLTLEAVTLGDEAVPAFDLAGAAEGAVGDVTVRSDSLSVNGEVLMAGGWYGGATPAPVPVTDSVQVNRGGQPVKLQLQDFLLSHKISNGFGETEGAAYYDTLARYNVAESMRVVDLTGNPVVVHTPVVATARLVVKPELDQRPEVLRSKAGAAPAMPLETVMQVDLGTTGPHLGLPGYGTQDFERYAKVRRLYLPFDAFCYWDRASALAAISAGAGTGSGAGAGNGAGMEGGFVPAGSWTVVPAGARAAFLRAPAWVDPGSYELLYQVVALNHRTPATHELAANLDAANDIAGAVVPATITGKLYGFAVTEYTDARWAPLFQRQSLGAGLLPLAPGSHNQKQYAALAPRPGYLLRFVVNSIGPYYAQDDLIYIKPQFEHLDPRSGRRQPVVVYYRHKDRWVMVGSEEDKLEWSTALQNGRRDLPIQGVVDTDQLYSDLGLIVAKAKQFIADSLVVKYVAKVRSVALGSYRRLLGPTGIARLGSLQNNPNGNLNGSPNGSLNEPPALYQELSTAYAPDLARYKASYQCWYGEYLLPNQILVLPADGAQGDILDRSRLLENGFLAVSFDISLCRGNQIAAKELVYGEQWEREGFRSTNNPWPTKSGDIIYYGLSRQASDDWQ